ncbi:ubinuclein-1-like isoform X2 [Acanthaster planci]|uniref:Ubinuclein-1-like isoform X2 n=1 Tax=Acanthaster planci TaxID=133434 RepID=A0A8B7Z281_ACAPL|nr:ubinuclein-1-like isoform X2 [Acanthaster planci]
MAERRRIIPSSVGPLFPLKKEKETAPSLRFDLTLKEPSDKTCSVFSYSQLVKNAVGNNGNGVQKSFNELDEEDMDGLESIAKKLEEKYAPKKGRKKRNACIDDLIDVGMGYDETDPFVDNSECYDELVPDVLTTQFGGFYINQGQLQFRERSDSENSNDFQDMTRRRKTPKKKLRKTSDGERKEGKRKRNLSSSSDKAAKKMRKQLERQFGKHGRKKKGLSSRIPTVAELLKQREEAKQQEIISGPSLSKPNAVGATSNATPRLLAPNAPAPKPNGLPATVEVTDLNASLKDIDPSLDLGLIMSDLKMDSDMAAAMEEALKGPMGGTDLPQAPTGENKGTVSLGPHGDDGVDTEEEVPMPSGLPATLVYNVEKIKEAARKSVEGKCKFFTASVNNLLLKIEHQSRELSCGNRSLLYSHLASNLPCTKETLLKRAKKLRLNAHDSNLKEPLQKLKEAIALAMPAQLERYQQECQAAAQDKYNAMMNKSQTVEDEAKSKSTRGLVPSKKFQWSEGMRELLCAIVSVKLQTYKLSKIRTQSAEDYLKAYLEDEIKPLWPSGWMQTRSLFKESRSVHGSITSLAPKQRRMLPAAKKPSSAKPSPEEASNATQADQTNLGQKQDKPDIPSITTESSQDSHVRTILDFASDSSRPDSDITGTDPQQVPAKDQAEIKSVGRSKTASTSETVPQRVRDPRDFVDLLIAEQLAMHDKAENSSAVIPKKDSTDPRDKLEVAVVPIKRNPPQEEPSATALQLEILRQAAMMTQSQGAWRAEGSSTRKEQLSHRDDVKISTQATTAAGSSHNSGRTTQEPMPQAKPPSKQAKTSFQLEFEKMYSVTEKSNPTSVPEVIKVTPTSSHKYKTSVPQQVNLSASAKLAQQKSAFEKLRLAGQVPPGFDASIPASQPVVKLTRHPNLSAAAGLKSNTDLVGQARKLVSPPNTHSSKREPLVTSHHVAQHGNTLLVTSTSPPMPARTPTTSLPISSASSLYQARKDTHFQSISQSGDRSMTGKHAGKMTPTTPVYTSPSPPKGSSPHSIRTSPYSTSPGQVVPASSSPRRTSPLGQKTGFSQYQHTSSSTSPGHSSSYSAGNYAAGIPTLPGYQQLTLADLTRKQRPTSPGFASPTFPLGSGHVSPGRQGSPGQSTSPGDAIITGPAPGTFYHTQSAGNIATAAASSSTNSQRLLHQQITLDSMLYAHQAFPEPPRKQKQHRIP